ncbi:MAG: sodium:solute symporter family protein [Sulfolobales archaeon]|nr:sodium:solute symporter family protein [Sulfolobales archaeon]MDW7970198.1 sodium:solute symporter family protein [Sulfolobales archaeon]
MDYEPYLGVAVLLSWLIVLVAVSVLSTRYRKLSVADFAITGGTLGTLTLLFTYSATYHSAYAFMGTTGAIYVHGISWWNNVHWVVLPPILMWFIGRKVWKLSKSHELMSYGDYLRFTYSGGGIYTEGLNLVASVTGFIYVLLYTAIQGLGVSYLFQMASKGLISSDVGLAIFVLLNAVIVFVGGARGVAWTDTVQGIFMILAYVAASIYIPTVALGNIFQVYSKAAQEIPQWLYLPGPAGLYTPQYWVSQWLTITLGMVVMPHIWLRYYMAKSLRVLKWASVFSAIYMTYIYTFTPALGLTAKLLYPKYPVPDRLVPEMLLAYTPFAFAAVVMAGALAAALSTSDSQLHSVTNILVVDIYKPYIRPNADERHLYNVARIATIILGGIVAMISYTRPGIFLNILAMATAGTAALFPIFIVPLMWRRVTPVAGFLSASVSEIIVGITTFVIKDPLGIASGLWGLTTSISILILATLITRSRGK